jgi:hypothetical protein
LRIRVATADDEQILCASTWRDGGGDEAGTDGDAVFVANEIRFVAVRTGRPGRTFRALRALLALNALCTLQALNALRAFGTRGTGITFLSALTGRTGRTYTGWTHRPGGTGGTWRALWTGGTVKPCGAAFCEQLVRDSDRVDGNSLFDATYTLIELGSFRFDLLHAVALV